jgi:hypothetical protein
MAKNLLQDMVRRKKPEPTKVQKLIKTPELVKIPASSTVRLEPVDLPEPVKISEQPKISKQVKHSDFETKFASVYDGNREDRNQSRSKYGLWIVAFFSVMFLLFALSYVFTGAKITINPKIKNIVSSNINLSAIKDGTPDNLSFESIYIPGEESKIVQGGTVKDVVVKATGKVIIYNAFNSATQPLAVDTRLEGSNGKIYKIQTKLTIPGMSGNTPGSVEATIYATDAGIDSNSGPLDFKIFGFKGTNKYDTFYARSEGDITGGFVGKSSELSDTDKAKVVSDIETSLKGKLFQKATDQIPSGFILWQDAAFLDNSSENVSFTPKDNMVLVDVKSTLIGFLFEESKLTEKIVGQILPNEDASNLYIPNIRSLTFAFANNVNPGVNATSVDFSLGGSPEVVWKVDQEKLVSDLLGQPKKNFDQILSNYPNIDSAQLSVRPFWKTSFPDKVKDIQLIVNYPK